MNLLGCYYKLQFFFLLVIGAFYNTNAIEKKYELNDNIIEEYAIIRAYLTLDSVGKSFEISNKLIHMQERTIDSFYYAFINFYNFSDCPAWYVSSIKKCLLLKRENINKNVLSLEEEVEQHCSENTYMVFFALHSYIAAFEEHEYNVNKVKFFSNEIVTYEDAYNILKNSDKYVDGLLLHIYKENKDQKGLDYFRKKMLSEREYELKNIENCINAFYTAMKKEQERVNKKELDKVFYFTIACIASSYYVPDDFLVIFRAFLLELARSPLNNSKEIHHMFNQKIQHKYGIKINSSL